MSVKKRILIIDDDDALREELTSQFAFFDEFETTAVGTATEGIQAAEKGDFDAIVLDIDLPDMQGTDACAVMRKPASRVQSNDQAKSPNLPACSSPPIP